MATDSNQEFVSLKQLAEMLGMDRSYARKWLLSKDFKPVKRRTSDSGGQLTLSFTAEETERIIILRQRLGFSLDGQTASPVNEDYGVFYIIQLIPEFDANRVKLGFASDVEQRLAEHRTASSTAEVAKTWPCKRAWEKTVIDTLTGRHCRLILNEVYACDDIGELVELGNKLFALFPDPKHVVPLSDHSPLEKRDK